jgi:hypothetical protein
MAAKQKSLLRRIRKIILWIIFIFLFLFGTLAGIAWFYGNRLLKDLVISTVETNSRGIYHLELKSLTINILTGRIHLGGFHLKPDTNMYNKLSEKDLLTPILFDIRVNKFTIRGLDFADAIRNKKISMNVVLIKDPDVTIFIRRVTKKEKSNTPDPNMLSIPLPKNLVSILLKKLELTSGKLTVINQAVDPQTTFQIPSLDVTIKNVLVDSVHKGLQRIFNSDDIRVALKRLAIKTKDGMYTIQIGEVGFSTQENHLWVKEFRLKPEYSNHDFSRKLGYQMDRMDVSIKKLDLFRMDFRRLIIYQQIIAGHVLVDGLSVDDYRDKRVPMRTGFFPLLPQQALMKSKMYIRLDSVEMNNGYIKYSEQTGNEPGFIFFDKATALATNVTNDTSLLPPPKAMKAEGTLYLMGKGKLKATIEFLLGSKNDQFIFSGTLDQFDMTLVNPMLTKLAPARVTSGTITKLIIPPVKADNDKAIGMVKLYYKNLTIDMESKKKDDWSKVKSGVLGWAANVYVKNSNPMPNGKFRDGVIYFERDKQKSLFNFLWKSAFFGLKSTMGINSEKQKEIKKAKAGKKK